MKKVLLLFVALFVATAVNAQISPITFGPKVGYQTTKLSTDKQTIKSDFKGNMAFGVFARLTIKNVILQPELLYYKSGKMFDVNLTGNNWGLNNPIPNPTFTINQSNLAMPVLLGYQFVDIPLIKMRANIGPVFYFAIGKASYSMNGENVPYVADDVTEDMTIGGALNLGVDLWKFTLDVNYSLGLTETFDDEIEVPGVGEFEIGDNTKQNIFTVTLGFKIL
ncbi:MAG: PorT family protein [Bacteroidales bacterium]|nr:PorT family protein [Bacteroidales bacterium]MBR5781126.1 PorT family protein [Bacteroidales bacterium]